MNISEKKEKGVALTYALVFMVVFLTIGLSLMMLAGVNAQRTSIQVRLNNNHYAIESGLHFASQVFQEQFMAEWSSNTGRFNSIDNSPLFNHTVWRNPVTHPYMYPFVSLMPEESPGNLRSIEMLLNALGSAVESQLEAFYDEFISDINDLLDVLEFNGYTVEVLARDSTLIPIGSVPIRFTLTPATIASITGDFVEIGLPGAPGGAENFRRPAEGVVASARQRDRQFPVTFSVDFYAISSGSQMVSRMSITFEYVMQFFYTNAQVISGENSRIRRSVLMPRNWTIHSFDSIWDR